jgi:23S rRNA (cytidine1920-2'-O)/16S rRNA (cytidine1409-2'-O)-methyltransferase
MTKLRLDVALVERGLAGSRARARDAVLRGCVRVDGDICRKPGQPVTDDNEIVIDDPASTYVSRAALKLIAGLDHFGLSPEGRSVLDLGASTGGFTQVLLERGAAHVIAVDVGHGQMAEALCGDCRVTLMEKLNARDLTPRHLAGRRVDAIVCDISFISLRLALPAALALAEAGAWGLFLVKPQFEVGRAHIGKGGLVRDTEQARHAVDEIARWLAEDQHWRILGHHPAPLAGGDGNQEYLLAALKENAGG